MDLLVDSQRRMENLAKVIRMKNAKYARIEALNKNIAKETEVIKGLRGERYRMGVLDWSLSLLSLLFFFPRYDKNFLLKANVAKISELQVETLNSKNYVPFSAHYNCT